MVSHKQKLRSFHLFAGAGGGILADLLLGHEVIGACEIEKYPRDVLLARQQDGILPSFPIWDDVCTLDGNPWRGTVDILCGGFPCQDISAAGKGAGISGERSGLWKEYARLIGEMRPQFVFAENSPMLRTRGLGVVLEDLAALGYNARWGVLGARDVGAPHKRDRMWVLAYSSSEGQEWGEQQGALREGSSEGQSWTHGSTSECSGSSRFMEWKRVSFAADCEGYDEETGELGDICSVCGGEYAECDCPGPTQDGYEYAEIDGELYARPDGFWHTDPADLAYAQHLGQEWSEPASRQRETLFEMRSVSEGGAGEDGTRGEADRSIEPIVGRVAHGVADRVHRLKAIGNGQVPQCAALAFSILSEGLI